MSTYICEWERADSPTRNMSEKDARAYYKAHAVAGDCRFALREGNGKPLDLQAAWARLLALVESRKETPSDRKIVEQLRRAWRAWSYGREYASLIPAIDAPALVKPRARKPAHVCPHCGKVAA